MMTSSLRHRRWSFGGKVAGLLAVLALAGCETASHPEDRAEAFPYKVSAETKSLTLDLTAPAPNLRAFLNEYIDRGKGALRVNLTSEGEGAASTQRKISQVTERLLNAGLRSSEVRVQHRVGAPDTSIAELTFATSTVVAPQCENFSSGSSFNPSNKRHVDFGCSNRRNIALMVANPQDLVRAQPMTDAAAPHSLHIINIYRSEGGDPSGTRGVGGTALRPTGAAGTTTGTATSATPTAGGAN